LKKDEIQHSDPSETKSKFTYNISNSAYRNEWGDVYEKRDFFSRCKALIIRIVPKVGPFSTLKFHAPTPEVEQLYMKSVNESLDHYRVLLADLAENKLRLPNDNLDTGAETAAATYSFTDKTYAQLVERLNGQPVSEALRQDILLYFADLDLPYATKKNHKEWKKVVSYLNTLRSTHATCSPASTARNWSFPK
jgi:hypothetical protein